MELSIEQIKQILENCIDGECHGACPLFLESQYCIDILAPNVLKVIKELEDWKAIAEQYQKQFESARADTAREMCEEIERFLVEKISAISAFRKSGDAFYDGEIHALELLLHKNAELKKKYTEGENDG